jgi:organic radical activating enzyme
MSDSLILSNDFIFYTLEGEGRYVGVPSVFMRLAMCNLTCKGFISKDSPYGCDSFISWSVKNKKTFSEIFTMLEQPIDGDGSKMGSYIDRLKEGAILKITGGEPLIQQNALLDFITAFCLKYEFLPKIDFETNGTIMPDDVWVTDLLSTFTVSPKLANNGDELSSRYNIPVLRRLVEFGSCFKFVIKEQIDVDEVDINYVKHSVIQMPKSLIWFMPCCGSRDEQNAVAKPVAEMCKRYGVKFSPRLQLLIWNKALRA